LPTWLLTALWLCCSCPSPPGWPGGFRLFQSNIMGAHEAGFGIVYAFVFVGICHVPQYENISNCLQVNPDAD